MLDRSREHRAYFVAFKRLTWHLAWSTIRRDVLKQIKTNISPAISTVGKAGVSRRCSAVTAVVSLV